MILGAVSGLGKRERPSRFFGFSGYFWSKIESGKGLCLRENGSVSMYSSVKIGRGIFQGKRPGLRVCLVRVFIRF